MSMGDGPDRGREGGGSSYAPPWPLSAMDDLLIHQTPDPVRVVWTSDVRAYDRHLMIAHSVVHDVVVATGGSQYPNLDMAEAFAIVNVGGQHAAVRATRRLGEDRADLSVGPIRPHVVRGLREWRFRLAETAHDIEFDLSWFDTTEQHLRDPHAGQVGGGQPPGRQRDVNAGFEGFGRLQGWVKFRGETIDLTGPNVRGTRDRHWGMRNGIGGPSQLIGAAPPRGGNGLSFAEFENWSIWGDRILHPLDSGRPPVMVVDVRRRLRFDPTTRCCTGGTIDNTLADGRTVTLEFDRIPHLTAYLRAGFYGGPNGGAPGSGHWQGELPADRPVEGEVIDARTPEGIVSLSGLNAHVCRVTCGGEETTGVLQTYDPNAYLRCERGAAGWAFQ